MVLIKIPASRFLSLALELVGFTVTKTDSSAVERFLGFFGTTPEAANALFIDLQTTEIEEAVVKEINFKFFLMTLNWLKTYTVEHVLAGTWHIHEDTVRKWT